MGTTFWLHVNHPNDKAILHRDDGCAWARKAADRKRRKLPYGEVLGDRNGAWDAFSTPGRGRGRPARHGQARAAALRALPRQVVPRSWPTICQENGPGTPRIREVPGPTHPCPVCGPRRRLVTDRGPL